MIDISLYTFQNEDDYSCNERHLLSECSAIISAESDRRPKSYKEYWLRAKSKIIAAIRMKQFMDEVKLYGTSPTLNKDTEYNEGRISTFINRKASLITNKTVIKEISTVPLFIFDPSGRFISSWNIFMAMILMYTAIVDPFVLSFIVSEKWDALFLIDACIDFTFMFDLSFTFNTAFYNSENQLVFTRKAIFLNYLKGWLLLDLASSIPFGLLEAFLIPSSNSATKLVRISRLRNIPKLLRLSRLIKIAKNLSALQDLDFVISMNQRILRFVKVVLGVILCVHVISCMWFLTARMDNFTPETWVVRFGYLDQSVWVQYQASAYWALTTLTTVGYGDIFPHTVGEKAVTIMWMVFAVYFISFSIGTLTTIFSDWDLRVKQVNEKLFLVDEFENSTRLPPSMVYKLKRAIRLSKESANFELDDKDFLFDKVPTSLKLLLVKNMFNGEVTNYDFFALRGENFMAETALYLESSNFTAGQVIWAAGEPCSGIYFIGNGRIHYTFGGKKKVFKSLTGGCYFGDIEIVNHEVRKFDVTSVIFTECLVLPKAIVLRIPDQFPAVWKDIAEECKERERKLYKSLAQMKILHEENRSGIGQFYGKDIKTRIDQEYLNLMEADRKGKKTHEEQLLERIDVEIQVNIDMIRKIESQIEGLVHAVPKKR